MREGILNFFSVLSIVLLNGDIGLFAIRLARVNTKVLHGGL
jgi:hypothetical protein